MKNLLFTMLVLSIPVFYLSSCSTSPEYAAAWQELQNEFQPMINMLEKGLYTDFINMYVDPRLVFRKDGASAMLTEFNMNKREQLLRVLKTAKNMQPTINTVQNIATFDDISFPYPLRFQKIGDRWYLLNGPAFENN
jgi:hypothetical protein